MPQKLTAPLAIPLDDGLTLRTLSSPDEVSRVAEFMSTVHGPEVGRLTERLLLNHPALEPADLFFVDTAGGDVVSSMTLVPWTLRYGATAISVGEMSIVATAESYRRRGLVSAQVRVFKERLAQRGCLLSIIQGIPHFYRQYGYDYAWPLEGGWRLELRQAPEEVENNYIIRAATLADLPRLARLYEDATEDLTVTTVRSEEVWRFLLTRPSEPDAGTGRYYVVCDEEGSVAAFFCLPDYHFGQELVLDEASRCTLEVARTIFAFMRREAESAGRPFIRLKLPLPHDLVLLARAWGGVDQGTYAWQLHVPDLPALLRGLAPALNERLAASLFSHYTASVTLSLYRKGLTLRFVDGRLAGVSDLHPVEKADASMPPAAVMPLVVGHRPLHELRRAFPDANARGEFELLLETLFPPSKTYLYQVY